MALVKHFIKDSVDVSVYDTFENMGIAAAEKVAQLINEIAKHKDEINILIPIAASQYSFLTAICTRTDIDWSKVNIFHVDEYIGLASDDRRTLKNELMDKFFGNIGIKAAYFLDGTAKDPEGECLRYARLLEEHKPDISVLGFGDNGHLAFNEPHCADFNDPKAVKIIDIDPISKKQQIASGYFKDEADMPDCAYTLTLPTLVSAQYKVCIVPFKNKARSSYDALFGEVGTACPASIIRTVQNVAAFFDSDSASLFLTATE